MNEGETPGCRLADDDADVVDEERKGTITSNEKIYLNFPKKSSNRSLMSAIAVLTLFVS